MKLTPIGVDLAKSVFQVHEVDEQTGEEINKTLKRCDGGAGEQAGPDTLGSGGAWSRV